LLQDRLRRPSAASIRERDSTINAKERNMKRNRFHSQSGFTLVEIAIVLVIIGLLLGGVLKGQEMIENAKVKSLINDFNAIKTAYYTYQDRYRRLPGDDGPLATLTARGGLWAAVTQAGDTNGILNATAPNTFNGTAENGALFSHLRAAGLLTGNPADTGADALPRNAFGGRIGITQEGNTLGYSVNELPVLLCASMIPGKAAAAIDRQLDDGVPNSGSVRAAQVNGNNFSGAAATAYNEVNSYMVCLAL
jgi:prepilin-type N-terminal cleavage/methylation domain-containing protein